MTRNKCASGVVMTGTAGGDEKKRGMEEEGIRENKERERERERERGKGREKGLQVHTKYTNHRQTKFNHIGNLSSLLSKQVNGRHNYNVRSQPHTHSRLHLSHSSDQLSIDMEHYPSPVNWQGRARSRERE